MYKNVHPYLLLPLTHSWLHPPSHPGFSCLTTFCSMCPMCGRVRVPFTASTHCRWCAIRTFRLLSSAFSASSRCCAKRVLALACISTPKSMHEEYDINTFTNLQLPPYILTYTYTLCVRKYYIWLRFYCEIPALYSIPRKCVASKQPSTCAHASVCTRKTSHKTVSQQPPFAQNAPHTQAENQSVCLCVCVCCSHRRRSHHDHHHQRRDGATVPNTLHKIM